MPAQSAAQTQIGFAVTTRCYTARAHACMHDQLRDARLRDHAGLEVVQDPAQQCSIPQRSPQLCIQRVCDSAPCQLLHPSSGLLPSVGRPADGSCAVMRTYHLLVYFVRAINRNVAISHRALTPMEHLLGSSRLLFRTDLRRLVGLVGAAFTGELFSLVAAAAGACSMRTRSTR